MSSSGDARPVGRAKARQYLLKAEEFSGAGKSLLADQRWNAAGLAAIHAGISASDAALVACSGLRSVSKDHGAATDLLERHVPEYGASQQRQLKGLLRMKNTVEYEERVLTEAEARSMTEQAGRFVRWSATVVASHLD